MKTKEQRQDKFIADTTSKIMAEMNKANDKYGGLPIIVVLRAMIKVIHLTIKFCKKNG